MMTHPPIPVSGEPLKAQWAGDLIRWIVDSVIPRGDGKSIKTDGNMISMIRQPEECEYRGYFKVAHRYATNGKLLFSVIDGNEEFADGTNCGYFRHGAIFPVPIFSTLPAPDEYEQSVGSTYQKMLCLFVRENYNDPSKLDFSAHWDGLWTPSENHISIPLAEVKVINGELVAIRQIQQDCDILFPGVL